MDKELNSLEKVLDSIGRKAPESGHVSLDEILDAVGRRSFGPILLIAGLITVTPIIGDIPGVPTLMGVLVFLIAIQILFRREHLWLPDWLLRKSVDKEKLCKVINWLRKPAGRIDHLLRPRLTRFTRDQGVYVIAVTSILIAAAMPPMEFVPFSANGAGAALTAFGLALIADDGLLVLLSLLITAVTFGIVITVLV